MSWRLRPLVDDQTFLFPPQTMGALAAVLSGTVDPGVLAAAVAAYLTANPPNDSRVGDLTTLDTTAKSNLVAAINEVFTAIGGAGATINDTATSTASVWSSTKTAAAIAALVASAPGALDTLKELADAINDDASFAATVTTALAGKVPSTRSVNGHALSADVTVSAADVGLGNVNNTADSAKPVSTAQATAIAAVTKLSLGLGSVDNTSDVNKPVSTATATALAGKAASVHTHVESDVTGLTTDLAAKVSTSTTVNGHALSANVTITQSDISGLIAALAALAPLASPALTGSPTVPTQTATDVSTKAASTAFVGTAVGALMPVYVLAPADPDPTTGSPAGLYVRRTT